MIKNLNRIVYLITNVLNDKKYVGRTTRTEKERLSEHCYKTSKCVALRNAIQQHGRLNFKITILEKCESDEEMYKKENHYIEYFNSLYPNGYNLNLGGAVNIPSEITKNRISKSKKTYYKNNPLAGKEHSEKLKKRYRENPELLKIASILKGGKYFKVFNKNTSKLVWEGISQKDCEIFLGVGQGNISSCLNFKKKSCNGYIFRFLGEEDKVWKSNDPRRRNIENMETKEVFFSLTEAAKKYGVDPANILRAAKMNKKCAGHTWRFLECP